MFHSKKEALAAATFVINSPRTRNAKALQNLAQFASDNNLFVAEDADLWDNQTYDHVLDLEKNREIEHEEDAATSIFERRESRKQTVERIEHNVESHGLHLMHHRSLPKIGPVKEKTSVNYQNPDQFYRTRLHGHVWDRNLRAVKEDVEILGASLYIRDADNLTPFSTALFLGYMDIANYLQEAMQQDPEPIEINQSA